MVDGKKECRFVGARDDGIFCVSEVVGLKEAKHFFFILFGLSVDTTHGAHLDDGAFVGGGKDIDVDRHALNIKGEDAKGCIFSFFGLGGDVRDVDRTFKGASGFLLAESADCGVADVEPAAPNDVLVNEESNNGFDGGFVELASVAN